MTGAGTRRQGEPGSGGPLVADDRPAVRSDFEDPVIEVDDLSLYYGPVRALKNVSLRVPSRKISALIGPSGCGKSTLLRCLNRLNDLIPTVRIEGSVALEGEPVYGPQCDPIALRRRVGMVFQKSNPFPSSIYDNVAYGCRIQGIESRAELDELVERSLRDTALWSEVKDRLKDDAYGLSGGQQQRLCIARALATGPDVILYDEPCSALDPIATARIEELMKRLAERYSQVIVTHNMQQASRVSDYTAFMYLGELVEFGDTERLFMKPVCEATEDYITGRFG